MYHQLGDDGFWAYSDLLFDNQASLHREALIAHARRLPGIDVDRLGRALDDGRHRPAILADIEAVDRAGIDIGTPATLIRGQMILGAVPAEVLRDHIDRALGDGQR